MMQIALEAKAEAESRGRQLLIYFATDYEELRPIASRLLSNISAPFFGLRSEEIGHIVHGR